MTQEVILPVPVLVVEDEEIIQQRLLQILIELGYKPDELIFTSNVRDSIQVVDTQPISLALVDLGLPDGSGIEIIEKIRSLESNTMILVVSA